MGLAGQAAPLCAQAAALSAPGHIYQAGPPTELPAELLAGTRPGGSPHPLVQETWAHLDGKRRWIGDLGGCAELPRAARRDNVSRAGAPPRGHFDPVG